MNKHTSWICDYNKNSGEGNLARIYLNSLKIKDIKVINPKYKFYLSEYIYQILGILVLWYYYFLGKKTIYVNYLPLWNSFIFLLCPPKTIFGPITGSIQINKIKNINSLIRAKVLPIFYHLSLIILNYRQKKILFATNILKKYVNKKIKKKSVFNFIPNNYSIKINKKKTKRIFDLIVYYRKHKNKFFDHHITYLENQINNKKKIIIVGDKINIKGCIYLGTVNKIKLLTLLKRTKFCLSGDDNLLSLFNLECLMTGVKIIFNHKLKFQISQKNQKQFKPYDYELETFL